MVSTPTRGGRTPKQTGALRAPPSFSIHLQNQEDPKPSEAPPHARTQSATWNPRRNPRKTNRFDPLMSADRIELTSEKPITTRMLTKMFRRYFTRSSIHRNEQDNMSSNGNNVARANGGNNGNRLRRDEESEDEVEEVAYDEEPEQGNVASYLTLLLVRRAFKIWQSSGFGLPRWHRRPAINHIDLQLTSNNRTHLSSTSSKINEGLYVSQYSTCGMVCCC